MLLTPHILTGIAIVTKVKNPILGLFLVLLSHYFLDAFPQKEYSIRNITEKRWNKALPDFLKVFAEIVFCLFILFSVIHINYNPLFLAAGFLAILPDGLTLLYHIFPENKLLQKHGKIHSALNTLCENKKISPFWGVASQIAVIAIAIFFILQ